MRIVYHTTIGAKVPLVHVLPIPTLPISSIVPSTEALVPSVSTDQIVNTSETA